MKQRADIANLNPKNNNHALQLASIPNISKKSHISYHLLKGEDDMATPLTYDFFLVALFEQGGGTHVIDNVEYKVQPFQLHLLFPGQTHRWSLDRDTVCHKLMVSRSYFRTTMSNLNFWAADFNYRLVIQLDQNYYQRFLTELLFLKKELATTCNFFDLVCLRCTILSVLIKDQAELKFRDPELFKKNSTVQKFLILVEQYFQEKKSPAFYAKKLFITPNYLNIICKKQIKLTATAVIQNRVILEAHRLIDTPGLSLKEISFQLGFTYPSNFSNLFRLKTGLSPTKYKRQRVAISLE